MKFPPVPENDFLSYIKTYYDECRMRFGKIEAVAGKWMQRDLLPGMSDFDTRFIVGDDMTSAEWCRMSEAVGQAHLHLCRKHPCWIRYLEHLPGINLTWNELTSESLYYPEYQQWTFYHTEEPERLSEAQMKLSSRKWDAKDEYFHLKKFCLYFGRYNRNIDPPVNMGAHAVKYPLHSRIMHYFNPAVMSAVCILHKKNYAGKFEAFETAEKTFPGLKIWEFIGEILNARYEAASWYGEKKLELLEYEMEHTLELIAERLSGALTLIPGEAGTDIGKWKEFLNKINVDPALFVFEHAKFARLMKGRLVFYAEAPEYFQTDWLIDNELNRMGNNLFKAPFSTYWMVKKGRVPEDPSEVIEKLPGGVLSRAQSRAAKEFYRLTLGAGGRRRRKKTAIEIAAVFDDYFRGLYALMKHI